MSANQLGSQVEIFLDWTKPLELADSKLGQTFILEVQGRLDDKAAQLLDLALSEVLSRGEKHILLELSRLDYLGSGGMRVLLGVTRRLDASDGRLVLCSLQPQVREVFEVAGFAFNLQPDRATALKTLPTASRLSRISALASRLLGTRRRQPISAESVGDRSQIDDLSKRVKSLIGAPSEVPDEDPSPVPAESLQTSGENVSAGRTGLKRWLSRFRSG